MTDQFPTQYDRENRALSLDWACRVATADEDPSVTIKRAQKYYEFLSWLVEIPPTPIQTGVAA